MRIPQKIDIHFDGHTHLVTTNVCARLYWTEVLETFTILVHKPR